MAGIPRILVVDDDLTLLQALPDTIRLRFEQAVVDTASSADQGLALIGKEQYDVVITDLVMPGHSGLWLMEEMAKLQSTPAVILMTAHLNPVGYTQKGAAFSFIRKPIDRQQFFRCLRSAIQYGQTRRRVAANNIYTAQMGLKARELDKLSDAIKAMQQQIRVLLDAGKELRRS